MTNYRISQIKNMLSGLRKKVLPQGLLYRFILIILVPLLFLQVAVSIVFFDKHWETVSRRMARDVVGEVGTVANLIEQGQVPLTDIGLVIETINRELMMTVYFEAGAGVSGTIPSSSDSTIRILVDEFQNLGYPFTLQDNGHSPSELAIQLSKGVLHVSIPRKRFFSSTVYVFLGLMFCFSVLLFLIAFLFMKNQVRAIVRLSRAAELFGRGQSIASFKPEGAKEVRQAGRSFIQMRNRIQRYLTERTGMLSGVSHDLRTPLTRMKLQLSLMKQTDEIQNLQQDVSEMEHMLEAYLSFARGDGQETHEKISLNGLVSELVEKLKKSGQKVEFKAETDVICPARPTDLSRAVMNLLTNAGRYAKHSRISICQNQRTVSLIIDDDGPGIPPTQRADVFRAFYRLEKSRNTKTGGIGLGLTIARDIVLSHGGDITLSDSPMGGLRAVITLPLTDYITQEDLW